MNSETCCRVLSIQSHVVSGYVGNKSATFPLQVLGCDVDAINSVQFSNHTGYQTFKGQVLSSSELANIYDGLKANGLNNYSHIITGYISSAALLNEVRQIILDLKQRNPNTVYVCDPVMGDHGQLYIPKELLPVYCDSIIPLANIITPNQFEAELLTGIKITDVSTAKSALKRLHEMGVKTVVISSTDFGTKDKLVQFASKVTADGAFEAFRIDIPYFDAEFTGTGDLFAALLLAWNHKHPNNFKLACETVVSTMHSVLQRTVEWSQAHTAPGTTPSMALRELRLVQSKSDIECPKLCVEAVPLTLGIATRNKLSLMLPSFIGGSTSVSDRDGAFGNSALNDLSGFYSEISSLSSEKYPIGSH